MVLTLAGERGQTEYFRNDPQDIKKEADLLNPLLQNQGIRLTARSSQKGHSMMNVDCLKGYEKVSENSHIPGIEPYDAASGFDGLDQWIRKTINGVRSAFEGGQIVAHDDPDHVFVGVVKGYPDKAVLGRTSIPDTYENKDLFHSVKIAHADQYDAALPNYTILAKDAEDPEITEHSQRWGKVLRQFYESDYHKQLAAKPEFIAARAKLER